MNKQQREPYLFLANFPREGWGLCNACKYAEWDGWSCCEAELHCNCPLDAISGEDNYEHVNRVWGEGADCWGFRPNETLHEMGIIAGIRAEGNFPHKNKKGVWRAIVPSKRDREEFLI